MHARNVRDTEPVERGDGEGAEGWADHDAQLGDGRDAGERECRLRGVHQVGDCGLGDGHGSREDAADQTADDDAAGCGSADDE